MRYLIAAALTLGLTAAPSWAATYTLRFDCLTNCAAQGLSPGDKATVSFGLDSAAFTPGGAIFKRDLQSFHVSAGSFALDLGELAASGVFGYWRSSIDTRPTISIAGSTVIDPDIGITGHVFPASRTVSMSTGFSRRFSYLTTAPAGACSDADCNIIGIGGDYVNFRHEISAPIPLPAPLLPLVAALGALAAVGGRRRAA